MTFSPFEENNIGKRDCTDKQATGENSTIFSYIQKLDNDDTVEDNIQPRPCPKRIHSTAQIDRLQVNTDITGTGAITIDGDVTAVLLSPQEKTLIFLTQRKMDGDSGTSV